jgi:glycosyltransferase involved in cell wall biosynthesis
MIYLHRCASARHRLSVYRIMQTTPKYLAAYKDAKKVLVASSYMKKLLVQNGLDARQITILPYFVRMPGRTAPITVGPDGPVLLFAGRLEAEKGLGYLLRSLATVSRPFRLLVAGEGKKEEAYKLLADKLGIADKVDFLGWMSSEQLTQIYEKITCLIFPSIWPEPFGMVGIEAFYNSRPVIAFDVGGVSDWLKDGLNGYLVPPQDEKQLADRIERLLADPDLAAQMGRQGYRQVKETFRDETHLEKLMGIFNTALS